jgi:hypothetical protein
MSTTVDPGRASRVDEPTVEYTTRLRGRDVSCWVQEGRIVGDHELVSRMARVARGDEVGDPVALARLVCDATGSEVTIRYRDSGGELRLH